MCAVCPPDLLELAELADGLAKYRDDVAMAGALVSGPLTSDVGRGPLVELDELFDVAMISGNT